MVGPFGWPWPDPSLACFGWCPGRCILCLSHCERVTVVAVVVQDSEGNVACSSCYVKHSSNRNLLEVCVDFGRVEVAWIIYRKVPSSETKWFFHTLWTPMDITSFMTSYLLATEWNTSKFIAIKYLIDQRLFLFSSNVLEPEVIVGGFLFWREAECGWIAEPF